MLHNTTRFGSSGARRLSLIPGFVIGGLAIVGILLLGSPVIAQGVIPAFSSTISSDASSSFFSAASTTADLAGAEASPVSSAAPEFRALEPAVAPVSAAVPVTGAAFTSDALNPLAAPDVASASDTAVLLAAADTALPGDSPIHAPGEAFADLETPDSEPAASRLRRPASPTLTVTVRPSILGDSPQRASGTELQFNLHEAVLSALSKNHSLRIQRMETDHRSLDIETEKSRFDTRVTGTLANSDRLGKQIMQNGSLGDNVSNRTDGNLEWNRTSPSGTQATVGVTTSRTRSARAPNLFGTRIGLDLTHPLLRGAGKRRNLIAVKQATLALTASKYELEAFVTALAVDVEKKYWGIYLAAKELEIVQESYGLALQQLEETRKRISLGSIPESEQAAAEAEVALREEGVINAKSSLETARIAFLRQINPDSSRFWEYQVTLTDMPIAVEIHLASPADLITRALERRPEMGQAKILLQDGSLEVVSTRNGLLPKLDFFVTLGKTGYAQTFEKTSETFGKKAYDLTAGLEFDLWNTRREARARDRQAKLTLAQREESLRNLTQLIQEDVLTGYLEVQRSLQQMKATAKTVEKQEEKLRVEEIKFSVGKTTAFQVAQAQRDVAASKIAELKAQIGYVNALAELSRLDGSLCESLGLMMAEAHAAP
jgi:outer membrane protein TolC